MLFIGTTFLSKKKKKRKENKKAGKRERIYL